MAYKLNKEKTFETEDLEYLLAHHECIEFENGKLAACPKLIIKQNKHAVTVLYDISPYFQRWVEIPSKIYKLKLENI